MRDRLIGFIVVASLGITVVVVGLILESYEPVDKTNYNALNYTVISQEIVDYKILKVISYNQTTGIGNVVVGKYLLGSDRTLDDVALKGKLLENEDGIIIDSRKDNTYSFLVKTKEPQSCDVETVWKNGTTTNEIVTMEEVKGDNNRNPCDAWFEYDYELMGDD